MLCVDRDAAALEFVAASAERNRLSCATICADFNALASDRPFDVVLAAEVAYDPPTFADLAATIARHLARDGTALLADGYRTDTRGLYRALRATGLAAHSVDLRVREEGHEIGVRITRVRR